MLIPLAAALSMAFKDALGVSAAWQFFLHNGGPHAVLWVLVSAILGGALRSVWKLLRRIADLLDTHTEGGLHDVLRALEGGRGAAGQDGEDEAGPAPRSTP